MVLSKGLSDNVSSQVTCGYDPLVEGLEFVVKFVEDSLPIRSNAFLYEYKYNVGLYVEDGS